MDPIQDISASDMAKERVTTWAAKMPAYCFTELCPDPMLRRKENVKKKCDIDLKNSDLE